MIIPTGATTSRRLPLRNGQSLQPASTSHRREPRKTRHQRGSRIAPIFPEPVTARMERATLGLPSGFAPRRPEPTTHAEVGDRPSSTDLEPPAQLTSVDLQSGSSLIRATSRRTSPLRWRASRRHKRQSDRHSASGGSIACVAKRSAHAARDKACSPATGIAERESSEWRKGSSARPRPPRGLRLGGTARSRLDEGKQPGVPVGVHVFLLVGKQQRAGCGRSGVTEAHTQPRLGVQAVEDLAESGLEDR